MSWRRPETASWIAVGLLIATLAAAALAEWSIAEDVKAALIAAVRLDGGLTATDTVAIVMSRAARPSAVAILLVCAMAAIATVVIELRARAWSGILAAQQAPLLVTTAVLTLWFGHAYLGPGVLLSGDTVAHVSMAATRAAAVVAGQDPTWTFLKYNGIPLQGFYAPTTYIPWLWLTRVTGDVSLALRLLLFAAHVLGAAGMFFAARRIGLDRSGAMFATLAFAGSFAHLHMLLYRGAIPQSVSIALLPWALGFLQGVAVPRGRARAADWFGLAFAAAGLVVNYTPFAILAVPFLAGFLAIAYAAAPRADRARPLPLVLALAAAGLAVVLLSAFMLLPAAAAGSEVKPLVLDRLLFLRWPSADYVDHLLVWRAWRTNFPGAAAYLGLSLLALAAIAVAGAWRTPSRLWALGLAALFVLSLFARAEHARDIMMTLTLLALLAGIGGQVVLGGRAGLAVLALVLLDLGSTSFQPVGRSDKGYLETAGAWLAAQEPSSRTLDGITLGDRYVPGSPSLIAWHGAELLGGGNVEMATPSWVYDDLAAVMVRRDLDGPLARLTDRTRTLLCLLRVGRIVADDRGSIGLPERIADTAVEGPLGRVLSPGCGYAVGFAPAVAVSDMPGVDPRVTYAVDGVEPRLPAFLTFLDALVAGTGLDARGVAERWLVRAPLPPVPAGGQTGPAVVHAYRVESGRVTIDLDVPRAGYVRLSHSFHTRLTVRRAGPESAEVLPMVADVMGFLVVPVPAGRSLLEIVPRPDPAARTGERVSLGALAALMLAAGGLWWRARTRGADVTVR